MQCEMSLSEDRLGPGTPSAFSCVPLLSEPAWKTTGPARFPVGPCAAGWDLSAGRSLLSTATHSATLS